MPKTTTNLTEAVEIVLRKHPDVATRGDWYGLFELVYNSTESPLHPRLQDEVFEADYMADQAMHQVEFLAKQILAKGAQNA